MHKFKIKVKLIVLFVVIKVIPLILLTYFAVEGAKNLQDYFEHNTTKIFTDNKNILKQTTSSAIEDSVNALDDKSQESLEKLSVSISVRVADFLYERDNDILFLSKLDLNKTIIDEFYKTKHAKITIHDDYEYDDILKKWISTESLEYTPKREQKTAISKDNQKEFKYVDPIKYKTKKTPIYKELSYIDLNGQELFKKSTINPSLLNVSKKSNTYIKAENYWQDIKKLKENEIYVSDVIGEAVTSKLIGNFTKEKASKMGIPFDPSKHGYAGLENPNGKKFEGIVRFITPVFKNSKKVAYLSFALDHRHIMEFTDTFNPVSPYIKQNIANAGAGNYAFMWDFEGKNISHPRDYFIVGYDSKTGQRVPGWLSKKVADDFRNSKQKDLNTFLEKYPKFDNQSLKEKPNIAQLKELGQVSLDCRYLNFAPQCQGWMQLTKNGGYGSFIILWSNVWKLTTAATIPYYTGKYANSKRGFGFITIGANVDEFHKAANITKKNIEVVLDKQTKVMENSLIKSSNTILEYINKIIYELQFVTLIMIIIVILIAIWMSNYITGKIQNLIDGVHEFADNHIDFQMDVTSHDEIGELEMSFNDMAKKLRIEIQKNQEKEVLLLHRNKMSSMGEMLENIAHQWRQPLSIISTAASGVRIKQELGISSTEEDIEALEAINESTQYLSETIEDFRNFFQTDKQKCMIYLDDICNKTIKIISAKLKNREIDIYQNLENIELLGFKGELTQVFMNILNNAIEILEVSKNKKKLISIDIYKDEDKAVIKILDNAGGISSANITKIFEPYFTTKHKYQGTGIGLYMSQEIIVKHMDGNIEVKNCEFKHEEITYTGACFIITLPLDSKS